MFTFWRDFLKERVFPLEKCTVRADGFASSSWGSSIFMMDGLIIKAAF